MGRALLAGRGHQPGRDGHGGDQDGGAGRLAGGAARPVPRAAEPRERALPLLLQGRHQVLRLKICSSK